MLAYGAVQHCAYVRYELSAMRPNVDTTGAGPASALLRLVMPAAGIQATAGANCGRYAVGRHGRLCPSSLGRLSQASPLGSNRQGRKAGAVLTAGLCGRVEGVTAKKDALHWPVARFSAGVLRI